MVKIKDFTLASQNLGGACDPPCPTHWAPMAVPMLLSPHNEELLRRIKSLTVNVKWRLHKAAPFNFWVLCFYLYCIQYIVYIVYCLQQGCPFHGSRAPRGSLRGFAMAL